MLVDAAQDPVNWSCPTDERAIERLRRKLEREAPGQIECCYEAGPTGYGLQRALHRGRITCRVIAPSLTPRKPGERVKTNRRDAQKLVELLRAGLLTEVQPPTPADEAVLDLCRARDQARSDLMRSRHRLSKFLLRRGLLFHGRNWTAHHRAWLQRMAWEHPAERHVVADYQLAIEQLQSRLAEIDRLLGDLSTTPLYARGVGALRCFRGIDTISAMMLLAELHHFQRFREPRSLMAYLGLVPSEDSTGDHRRRGAITKTGNAFVRRILVEVAWHYRHDPHAGAAVSRRRAGQPLALVAIAERAEQRLCYRYRRLTARMKPKPKIAAAIARELVGFIWAALQLIDVSASA
jgi:transposase